MVHVTRFHIHGDNIVECNRAFQYVVTALGELVESISGPSSSVTCPIYKIVLGDETFQFQCLPGYGERRWNQDVLSYVKSSGGRLREAADAIITRLSDDLEKPIAAIEFCGALPAGNQAWQRQGRAFSFAHAKIPYFYIAELGGFELTAERERKAERLPNPAVPFSFFAMTHYQGSVCLPVYEANSGARPETIRRYSPIFGKDEFLEFLRRVLLDEATSEPAKGLGDKCTALVELLASSKKRQDGLTANQWVGARAAVVAGGTLTGFLTTEAPLKWSKVAYIAGLTQTARAFMALGAECSLGLTSSALPLSFVPKAARKSFADKTRAIYADLTPALQTWLADDSRDLAISWVMGFKPRGDDARPDRGLPPLARMLIGDDAELLTFVYGPAPASHWNLMARDPARLAASNGLWEAALGVSDGLLIDSATQPPGTPRGYQKAAWAAVLKAEKLPLRVAPTVRSFGEQDVDTALHVIFESLGAEVAFEGMCNPPGGDWSGISFKWSQQAEEHRWLTLPRVSATGAKRPDHVFALFGHGDTVICLCVESKERARSLETDIGPRLVSYTQALFDRSPSIIRTGHGSPWSIHEAEWGPQPSTYISVGSYLADPEDPFRGLPDGTNLDVQMAFSFTQQGKTCDVFMKGTSPAGKLLVTYLLSLKYNSDFVNFIPINS